MKYTMMLEVIVFERQHEDLELLNWRWSTESYTYVADLGEFTLTLEDVVD